MEERWRRGERNVCGGGSRDSDGERGRDCLVRWKGYWKMKLERWMDGMMDGWNDGWIEL